MKPLYATDQELKDKCEEYLKKHDLWAPRSFRIYLGVSKDLLSKWKNMQPEYFNLIKSYEDKILAKIEEYAIYGASHPDLNRIPTKVSQTGSEVKFNNIGAMFVLRAYDREHYIPELTNDKQLDESTPPLIIQATNTSGRKLDVIETEVKENASK